MYTDDFIMELNFSTNLSITSPLPTSTWCPSLSHTSGTLTFGLQSPGVLQSGLRRLVSSFRVSARLFPQDGVPSAQLQRSCTEYVGAWAEPTGRAESYVTVPWVEFAFFLGEAVSALRQRSQSRGPGRIWRWKALRSDHFFRSDVPPDSEVSHSTLYIGKVTVVATVIWDEPSDRADRLLRKHT